MVDPRLLFISKCDLHLKKVRDHSSKVITSLIPGLFSA